MIAWLYDPARGENVPTCEKCQRVLIPLFSGNRVALSSVGCVCRFGAIEMSRTYYDWSRFYCTQAEKAMEATA